MIVWNLYAGWIGFLLGALAGATVGLFFHQETWLGGYTSWRRRLLRLAHISFFGIGILNLLFYLTVKTTAPAEPAPLAGWLLLCGAVTMPLVCYLSAWRALFRHLFFVPAGSVMVALGLFVMELVKWK